MARRKNNRDSIFSVTLDLLAKLPWWVCIVLAVISYSLMNKVVSRTPPVPQDLAAIVQYQLVGGVALAAQYVLPILFLSAAGLSFFSRKYRQELLANTRTRQRLDGLNWRDFELLVGEAYRRQGYAVTELGGDGPDGGVDLVLKRDGEKVFVQCKHWKATSVGVDVVRQIFGVMAAHGASGCIVVTSGTYTSAAEDFARGRNVVLVDGPRLFRLIEGVEGDGSMPATERREPPNRPAGEASPALPRREDAGRVQTPPACPACQEPMVLRSVRNGPHPGRKFWGCSHFPSCRGTRY